MKEILTKQNVVIDICNHCREVWLDEGEINFLADDRKKLFPFYSQGLIKPVSTSLSCPRCKVNLFKGTMPEFGFEAETCPKCRALLLGELELGLVAKKGIQKSESAPRRVPAFRALGGAFAKLPALPSLATASLVVMSIIYSLLFAVLLLLSRFEHLPEATIAPILIGIIFLQFLLAPWFTDISLSWIGSLEWVDWNSFSPNIREFVRDTCAKNKIPPPKVGLIMDDAPNAFTYGRTPSSARLVLTRGILDNLSEDEVKAVIGHELGHIVHWDFVVMTIAQIVPVLLYEVYRLCGRQLSRKKGSGGSKKGRTDQLMITVAVISYIFYLISHYCVMYLSRIREYWADRFGAEAVGDPNHLSSALIKIGYGLAYGPNAQEKYGSSGALGIFDPKAATAMSVYADSEKEDLSDASAQDAMQWDLLNPWATYYEIQSTHPLIAKRINALAVQAKVMQIEPKIQFDLKPTESYWDDFFVDFFYILLPYLCGAATFALSLLKYHPHPLTQKHLAAALVGLGIGALLKFFRTYPAENGLRYSVAALLKKIKVSGVRGIPVKISGKVIGRGNPGSYLSEDFFIRDKTGIIFLDYSQPFQLVNLLFAIFRRKKYNDAEVEVTGWYRRSPVPYIEIFSIRSSDGTSSQCYTYIAKLVLSLVTIAGGFILWMK